MRHQKCWYVKVPAGRRYQWHILRRVSFLITSLHSNILWIEREGLAVDRSISLTSSSARIFLVCWFSSLYVIISESWNSSVMGKKIAGIIVVCLVAIAIVAVVALIATSQEDKGCRESEQEDFFCCKDLKTKLLGSQVGIYLYHLLEKHFWFGNLRIKSWIQIQFHNHTKTKLMDVKDISISRRNHE